MALVVPTRRIKPYTACTDIRVISENAYQFCSLRSPRSYCDVLDEFNCKHDMHYPTYNVMLSFGFSCFEREAGH